MMEIAGELLGMDCDKTIHRYFRSFWRHLFSHQETAPSFYDSQPIIGRSSRKFETPVRASIAECQSNLYCGWGADTDLRIRESQFFQVI